MQLFKLSLFDSAEACSTDSLVLWSWWKVWSSNFINIAIPLRKRVSKYYSSHRTLTEFTLKSFGKNWLYNLIMKIKWPLKQNNWKKKVQETPENSVSLEFFSKLQQMMQQLEWILFQEIELIRKQQLKRTLSGKWSHRFYR